MALNTFKNLRISSGKTESSSVSKKILNKSSASNKTEEKSKIVRYIEFERDKKTSSKDESSLATAPDNHENCNGNGT